MPSCWIPGYSGAAAAKKLGLDANAEAENFRDWTTAKGMLYADWDAAFRSHLKRRADQRPAAAGQTHTPRRPRAPQRAASRRTT